MQRRGEQPADDCEITPDSLRQFLEEEYPNRDILLAQWPKYAASSLRELVTDLRMNGYVTIGKLQGALARAKPAFDAYEEDHPPNDARGCEFAAQGLVRLSMLLLHDDFSTLCGERLAYSTLEELRRYRRLMFSDAR